MSANAELTALRHQKLFKRFKKLRDVKTADGRKKHTYAYIMEKLSKEFFYTEDTIQKIITRMKE